jgi:hypothetical protein
MEAAFEAAITRQDQHQVDADAGRDDGADQRAAVAVQVLGQAALGVAVQGDPHVVPGAWMAAVGPMERPLEVQDVDDGLAAGHGRRRR